MNTTNLSVLIVVEKTSVGYRTILSLPKNDKNELHELFLDDTKSLFSEILNSDWGFLYKGKVRKSTETEKVYNVECILEILNDGLDKKGYILQETGREVTEDYLSVVYVPVLNPEKTEEIKEDKMVNNHNVPGYSINFEVEYKPNNTKPFLLISNIYLPLDEDGCLNKYYQDSQTSLINNSLGMYWGKLVDGIRLAYTCTYHYDLESLEKEKEEVLSTSVNVLDAVVKHNILNLDSLPSEESYKFEFIHGNFKMTEFE
jgi:hypothetical protein